MNLPRVLSTFHHSPNYDKAACEAVDKVFCNEVHVERCAFYDMNKGVARGMGDAALRHGVIRVTVKQGTNYNA